MLKFWGNPGIWLNDSFNPLSYIRSELNYLLCEKGWLVFKNLLKSAIRFYYKNQEDTRLRNNLV